MSTRNSHTDTTNDREKRRETQGTKGKLQPISAGGERRSLCDKKKVKQVTGLTPGTEGSIPGKQSNTAGKKGDCLSEQRST